MLLNFAKIILAVFGSGIVISLVLVIITVAIKGGP